MEKAEEEGAGLLGGEDLIVGEGVAGAAEFEEVGGKELSEALRRGAGRGDGRSG